MSIVYGANEVVTETISAYGIGAAAGSITFTAP